MDPYRILFPLGVVYAILAAFVWPLYAAGWIPYPATLHWTLMVQGFLHCFVLGFLMTAMPAFLHAEKTRAWELSVAVGAMVLFGVFAFAGLVVAAQVAYLVTLAVLVQAGVRRVPRRRGDPAEEFLFVVLGFAFAVVGAVMGIGVSAGWWEEPAPRFALHLFTKGMMLSIVLGLGGLLVPTFSAMRERGADWSRWQRPRPTPAQRRRDVWLGLAVVAGSVFVTVLVNSMGAFAFGTAPSLSEQVAWTAAMSAPLMVRTRFPVAVLCMVGVLFIAAQVRQIGDNSVPSIVLFLAIYTVGAWEPNRTVARWARIGVIAAMFGWLGVAEAASACR